MDRLQSVLVGVDFSGCSAAAVRQGARIAAWSRARLTVLHAVAVPIYAVSPEPFLPMALPPVDLLLEDARRQWENWPPAREAGADARFEAILGTPRIELVQAVRRGSFDLLVLGAHGGLDADRALGATAAACVQRARCKVLVVRERHSGPFRSVVACIDFSETSRLALEQAVRIAAQDGAALAVLHVYDDPWRRLRGAAPVVIPPAEAQARYRGAVEESLRAFCEPMTHELGALKAEFVARAAEGHGPGILDFVGERGIDLAVLGTRSRWNLRDFVWGSTAEHTIRRAPCAVLAVKPAGFEAPT